MHNQSAYRSYLSSTLSVMGLTVAYVSLVLLVYASHPELKLVGVLHPWTGLMLALLLKDRRRYWLGVLLGMIVVEALVLQSTVAGIPIGIGRALGVYVGAWLILRNVRFSSTLPSLRDYLRVLVLGGAVCAFTSATIRALVLLAFDINATEAFSTHLYTWWMGDALGIAILSPLLLVFSVAQIKNFKLTQMFEPLLLLGLSFLAGQIVFLGWFGDIFGAMQFGYLMFLFVAWVAVRLGKQGTAVLLLMISAQAIWGATSGKGFFASGFAGSGAINFWLYMMTLSVVGMALAAYVSERHRNEEILHGESLESLSQRDHALREITQGVVITDEYRRATYINEAFTRQTGYLPEEILGKSCRMLQGRETSTETLARMKSLLDSGLQFQGEILNYRKDGSTFWNDMSITPVFDVDGKLVQWVGIQRDITEQKLAEARILRLSHLYSALSHCNHAIVHSGTKEDLFRQVCRSAVEFGGMKMAWIGKINGESQRVLPVASYGDGLDYLENVKVSLDVNDPYGRSITGTAVRTGEACWCQDSLNDPATLLWRELGEKFGIRSMAALPLRKNGIVVGNFTLYASHADAFDEDAQKLLQEMAQDVSFALDNFEREAARKNAEAQRRLASKVFAESGEGIAIADANYNIVMINKRYTETTGFTEDDVLGQNAAGMNSDWRDIGGFQTLIDAMETVGYWEGEFWTQRRDREPYLERFSVRRVFDEEDNSVHYVAMFADITDHRKSEERMHWLSHFDPLTGLTNRTLLEDRCRQAISMAQSSGDPLALMFLDLDHFKNINETIGHRIGDLLLVELANRLSFIAREQDTVSRLGGDDFVLVLPGIDADGAAHIAERVMAAIAHPFQIEEHELSISGSIGIAMYPIDGANFEELIKCADMAMYRAKQDGRNTFCFFTAEIQARSVRTLQLENGLRRALERKQLLLHYQPQVSLDDGCIIGAEALIRWQHPEFGLVSPLEFIPIAESSGLILPIGEWVMRTAAHQLKAWMDMGFAPMVMSVNLSAVQFRQSSLPDLVMEILEEAGVPPKYFELELTESTAMENPEVAIAVMDNLHQRGIRMSIDDFGTGYSSLAHLKRFKVYKLKIDRSFVCDIPSDADDKAIVRAVINLAEGLGLQTIAEGVETVEQLDFLRANGCNEMQGYYYSRPIPADQFEALLHNKCELNG